MRNASANAVGIPQDWAVAVARFGADGLAGAISTRVVSPMKPSRTSAIATARTVRQLIAWRRVGVARLRAEARRDRA